MLEARLGPISNREDWTNTSEVRDTNNALVDLTGCTIVVAVRDRSTKQQLMAASTDDGSVVILSTGIFQWGFPLSVMRGLNAKAYEIGCTILRSGSTMQFFTGTVSIEDGIVQ